MATDATTVTDRQRDQTAEVFDDLVRESLRFLLPATLALAYVWAAGIVLFDAAQSGAAFGVFAVLGLTAWASRTLDERHLHGAIGLYLAALALTVTIIAVRFWSPASLYLYAQVLVIAAMLTNARWTRGIALGITALMLVLGRARALPASDLALPVGFVLFTALTSWLGSRRLVTALAWALNMTQQAQKNAEEARQNRAEVQRVLVSLDDAYVRLERANEALIFAREAAEKAYRFKAEFVANVSHELRTPLNLIVGFSEMMATAPESYGGVPLPSQYRGDVTAIYRSAKHLSDLINDVLDLSQIETGKMPLTREPASLAEIAQEAADIVRGLAEARGLQLGVDVPADLPMLMLDKTRIRQVLLNLLTNALRFTQVGRILVRVRAEGQEAIVSVEDTGCGIAPAKLKHAFEAFTQMTEAQLREGSGLGLAVSKKFIELHGGRMWLESEVGRGTSVYFSLAIPHDGQEVRISPLVRSAARQVRPAEPRVLVLHDDVRTLDILRRHIHGCHFVLADNASAAARIIRDEAPAVVVADITPGEAPVGAASSLALPAHIPLLTCPLPSMRRIGLLLGAVDYLPKPITRKALSEALARLPHPPHKALVVDDDVHIVRLLARMLRACDGSLQILKAFGGKEGLDTARAERPDVILLDLCMPGTSGYDLLEQLARDEELSGTQTIIVSVRTVEQESRPIQGELHLKRDAGFTLAEMLQLLQSTLSVITRSGEGYQASGEARSTSQPG